MNDSFDYVSADAFIAQSQQTSLPKRSSERESRDVIQEH